MGFQGEIKKANEVSHRYDRLPLLPSGPGGVRQELVVLVCQCKVSSLGSIKKIFVKNPLEELIFSFLDYSN